MKGVKSRGYGLVFYRGPVAGVITPTGQANNSLVYLTVRSSNDDFQPMAYAQVPTTDRVLEQITSWVSSTTYAVNDKVTRGGTYYLCIRQNTNHEPGVGNWTTYWTTDTQHLNNWSTIAVDIQEAASITLNSDPGFVIGKSVSNQNGSTGVVIDKIYTLSGSPVLLLNGSNGVGVGTFAVNDTVVQETISATVSAWRPRDNYIRAYYGDKDSTQAGNLTSLDNLNRRKYLRLTDPTGASFNWPTKNPTADDNILTGDLFTIVQWTIPTNSTDGTIMQDELIDLDGTTPVLKRTIIRSNLLITSSYVDLVPPEIGILAFGNDAVASSTFLDNFAYKLKGTSAGGGMLLPVQQ